MSKKTVAIKMPAQSTNPAEAWVSSRAGGATPEPVAEETNVTPLPQPAEPMKRFTIDVPASLHKRIKAQCAMRETPMADVIRDMLEQEFPAA